MNRSLLSRVLSGLLAALLFSQAALAAPPEIQTDDTASFEAAIRGSIRSRGEAPFLIFDTGITRLVLSPGGDWGTAWIYPLDPDSGEALPGEPGLVVGLRRGQSWHVVFPADPDWQAVVREVPETLLSAAEKEDWLLRYSTSLSLNATTEAPYGGFLLPWARGLKIILTRSILHYNPPNPAGSMHYSFDFAHPWVNGSSPMFNLYASKSGVVKYFRWVQLDNDHASPGNYMVVEDTSTTPATYHVYLHLGYDSIPPELRVKGAPVYQGQYIGKAGNTGFSTGNHLHFQVHTNPTSYWGTAVDITFDDVAINGGRPRMETEAKYFPIYGSEWQKGNAFYSENDVRADFIPPSGGILLPTMGSKITSASMRVEGWARDDQSGLYSTHVLANWGSGWQTVAGPFTGMTFSADVDLCTARVPDGPFSVALRVQDWENNLSLELTGLSHYIKEYTCSPVPACVPQPGEAALFAEKDFRGACQVFPAGTYTTAQITLPRVESLRVGSGAQAVLFQNPEGTGRAETFFASDSSLGDNRIGAGTFGALRIAPAAAVPHAPQPTWPLTGTSFTTNDSISLAWEDRGGGQGFTVAITGTISHTKTVTGTAAYSLAGLNLPAGSYSWRVQAGNIFTSTLSAWSAPQNFGISAAASSPVITSTLPITFSMESDAEWVKTPFWGLDSQANYSESGGLGWAYRQPSTMTYLNTAGVNSGSLTSPAILVPPEGAVAQFWYRYQTEGPGLHWDRRWVQVSANDGPFTNLLQLAEDRTNVWQLSPELDLSAFKGQQVRLRFHFETLDSSFNSFSGWEIDDLVIRPGAGRVCSDTAGSTHTSASVILIGTSQDEMICPAGDVDFYKFTANAGETIEAFTFAAQAGSTLDTVLYLLDSDGLSVLAENDDIRTGVQPDSALSYTFSRTGTYYLKVRSWHHPSRWG
jgi:murein DD-endopeptidase MepM/ murein hydrolase activator NlpD